MPTRTRQPPPAPGPTDTVPAMLTPGEYVMKRDAVKRIGVDKLNRLNNGVAGYDKGGSVDDTPAPHAQWVGGVAPRAQPVPPPAVTTGPASTDISRPIVTTTPASNLPPEIGSTIGGALITHYGYPGDSSWDSASGKGIGDRKNQLTPLQSVALTVPMRKALFGTTGSSTGKTFQWGGQTYRDDDTAPESDMRIDVFNPAYTGLDEGVSAETAAQRAKLLPEGYAGYQTGGLVPPAERAALQTAGQYAGTRDVLTPENAPDVGLDPSKGFIANPPGPPPITKVLSLTPEKAQQMDQQTGGGPLAKTPAKPPADWPDKPVETQAAKPAADKPVETQAAKPPPDWPDKPAPEPENKPAVEAKTPPADWPDKPVEQPPKTQPQATTQQPLFTPPDISPQAPQQSAAQKPFTQPDISPQAPQPQQPAAQQPTATTDTGPFAKSTQEEKSVPSQSVTGTEFGWVDRQAVAAHPEKYPSQNRGFPDFGGVDLSGENAKGVSLPPEDIVSQLGPVLSKDAQGVWHATPEFAKAVKSGQIQIQVTNPANGKIVTAPLVDLGPGKQTGAGIDVLHGTATDLGFTSGKAKFTYRIAGAGPETGVQSVQQPKDLADAALKNVGRLTTSQDAFANNGELGCADAVSRIVRGQMGYDIAPTLSTRTLYDELRTGGWQEVDPHTPGAIIVSPSTDTVHGHTGIVGKDGKIYSNSSKDGSWGQNYTVDGWKNYFSGKGLEVHAFIPTDKVARVAPGPVSFGGEATGLSGPSGPVGAAPGANTIGFMPVIPTHPPSGSAARSSGGYELPGGSGSGPGYRGAQAGAQSGVGFNVFPGMFGGGEQQQQAPPQQQPPPGWRTTGVTDEGHVYTPSEVAALTGGAQTQGLPAPAKTLPFEVLPPAAPGAQAPAQLPAARPPIEIEATRLPDPSVVQGLMKRGFTKAQAEAFAAKASVSQPGALPISGAARFRQSGAVALPFGGGPPAPPAPTATVGKGPGGPGVAGPRQVGGITLEHPPGAPGSTQGVPNPPGFGKRLAGLLQANQLKEALKEHTGQLSPDDTRVRKQSDNKFKGEHFQAGDMLHSHLMANVPEHERNMMSEAEDAIRNKRPMHVTYASAPELEPGARPTTHSRRIDYEASSPQARLLGGGTEAQLAGHSFIPVAVGVTLGKKQGAPHEGDIHGVSTNALANNHHHLNKEIEAMGEHSPYPHLDEKFARDLEGYVRNLNAGYRGTGEEPAPGTEQYPTQVDPSYQPHRLARRETDFINAAINNQAAQAKTAESGKHLRELAREAGTLITEDGETNALRHAIDARHQALLPGHQKDWSDRILERTIRTFKAGLIHSIHERAEDIPEGIRPGTGHRPLTESIHRTSEMGRPDVPVAANLHEGGLVGGQPPATSPPSLTHEEYNELAGNIRKQFLSGKLKTAEYLERMKDVPEPGVRLGMQEGGEVPQSPGGTEQYVSPNVEEGTKIPGALRQAASGEHHKAREFYQRVEDAHRPGGKVTPTTGNWEGTAEGSSWTHSNKDNLQEARMKAALKGLYSAQKGTAVFQHHEDGLDRHYDIDFPELDHAGVDKLISEHGFPASTVYQGPSGLRAHLIDSRGENHEHAIKLAAAARSQSPRYQRGTAVFDGGDTRASAAEEYRRILGASGIRTRTTSGRVPVRGHPAGGQHPLQRLYEEAEDNFARYGVDPRAAGFQTGGLVGQGDPGQDFLNQQPPGGPGVLPEEEQPSTPAPPPQPAPAPAPAAGPRRAAPPQMPSAPPPTEPAVGPAPAGPPAAGEAPPKKSKKSAEELALEKQDLLNAKADRENITPEQQKSLRQAKAKAQAWVKANPQMHPLAAHQFINGHEELPDWIKTKEHVGRFFGNRNKRLDFSKEEHRKLASDALTHDMMHSLAKDSSAYDWYDRTVDKSLHKIGEIAPEVLAKKDHALAFKLATAITSQGQDVFPNFESGYMAYRHWKKTGKMPVDPALFGKGPIGGGTKHPAMIANFQKINDLWEKHGHEGLQKILETPMAMRELRDQYGIKLGGESPEHVMEGAAMLGPKIGSFFNNLNKRFHSTTFDLWASRTLNRLGGNMMKFSRPSLLTDKKSTPSQLSRLENLLKSDQIEGADQDEKEAMKREAAALRAIPADKALGRDKALKLAPTITEWAEREHRRYATGSKEMEGGRSYPKGMKTESSSLAKNMDLNFTDLQDSPRGPKERAQWRQIFDQVKQNMANHGIKLDHATIQALAWYQEQNLFKLAGSRNRASFDYLDSAHRLVRKIKSGQLPGVAD